jgi:hypothetical protein
MKLEAAGSSETPPNIHLKMEAAGSSETPPNIHLKMEPAGSFEALDLYTKLYGVSSQTPTIFTPTLMFFPQTSSSSVFLKQWSVALYQMGRSSITWSIT